MKKILVLIALSFMTVSTLTAQMKDPQNWVGYEEIIGDGGLSVFGVYHLPWAVKWIQAKREVDRTFVLWDNTQIGRASCRERV